MHKSQPKVPPRRDQRAGGPVSKTPPQPPHVTPATGSTGAKHGDQTPVQQQGGERSRR